MPKKDSITLNILGEDKTFYTTVAEAGMSEEDVEELVKDKANLVNGVVPEQELPSYVDDVVEYSSQSAFPQQGEAGKIYVALDTGFIYRWSGSTYVQIGTQDLSNYYTKTQTDAAIQAAIGDAIGGSY